jgi:hypothetical protein
MTIAALVKRGHLEVKIGGGRNKTNQYRSVINPPLTLKTLNHRSPFRTLNHANLTWFQT